MYGLVILNMINNVTIYSFSLNRFADFLLIFSKRLMPSLVVYVKGLQSFSVDTLSHPEFYATSDCFVYIVKVASLKRGYFCPTLPSGVYQREHL